MSDFFLNSKKNFLVLGNFNWFFTGFPALAAASKEVGFCGSIFIVGLLFQILFSVNRKLLAEARWHQIHVLVLYPLLCIFGWFLTQGWGILAFLTLGSIDFLIYTKRWQQEAGKLFPEGRSGSM